MSSINLNTSRCDFKSINLTQYDEDDSYKQELRMVNTARITPAA